MGQILIKDQAGSVTLYLRDSAGAPVSGLLFSAVTVDFRKAGGSFANKILAVSATTSIGTGSNGTVNISVDAKGAAGNSWTVTVTIPGGTAPLTVSLVGTAITVALAVSGGVPVGASNTATLVAAAIEAAVTAVTAVASGTGADSLSIAEPTENFTGGADYWTSLGGGFYEVDFLATDLNVVGNLIVRATGPTVDTSVLSAFVATTAPTSSGSTVASPPETVALFGWVYDVDGDPLEDATASFRIIDIPTVLSNGVEGSVVALTTKTVKTDSDGFFTVDIIVGATVDVSVPSASYRRILVVPSTSQNVFDIP